MPAPNEIAASVERENEAIVLRYVEGCTTIKMGSNRIFSDNAVRPHFSPVASIALVAGVK